MMFTLCFILTMVFMMLVEKQIKKREWCFYAGTMIMICVDGLAYVLSLHGYSLTYRAAALTSFMDLVHKGTLGTALFAWVMLAGALNKKWRITRTLLKLRGEASILASLLVTSHIVSYTVDFFKNTERLGKLQGWPLWTVLMVFLCGIFAAAIMAPLMVTSFKSVRRKMNGRKWKQLQQYAYIFYGLIYLHVLVVYLGKPEGKGDSWTLAAYSLVFGVYGFLRIRRAVMPKIEAYRAYRRKEVTP